MPHRIWWQSSGLIGLGPIAQLVEHRLDKAGVSGSSPLGPIFGPVAQLVERLLCKPEVSGSSPLRSIFLRLIKFFAL